MRSKLGKLKYERMRIKKQVLELPGSLPSRDPIRRRNVKANMKLATMISMLRLRVEALHTLLSSPVKRDSPIGQADWNPKTPRNLPAVA
jgi:hypothetical protein